MIKSASKSNITIKDIADRASVSTTTVSSILNNGKIIVSPETRANVLSIVQKLGYRPSKKARQLRFQRNKVIAFQIDSRISSDNAWRPSILLTLLQLQGVSCYANDRGYNVIVISPRKGKDVQEIEKQIINENSVDGIILSGWRDLPDSDYDSILSGLSKCHIPILSMDNKVYERGHPSVTVNLRPGIRKAFARLQELGHRHLGYIGGTGLMNPQQSIHRYTIISEELPNYGLALCENSVFDVVSEVDAYRKTLEIAKYQICQRPTCMIYGSDHLAMSGIMAIIDCGLHIPDDISVIGIDNAPYAAHSPVPLSTIDQTHFEQGVMLAKQLIDKIENPQEKIPSLSVIECSFIERKSLGPVSQPIQATAKGDVSL